MSGSQGFISDLCIALAHQRVPEVPFRCAAQGEVPFEQFIGALLPTGGMIMALVEGYFDESMGRAKVRRPDGSERHVPILCVAGYLMESSAAKQLCREWQEVLDWKGLTYFHMVDCAHGNEEFANLTKHERIHVAARMIGLIKKHTLLGVAISVNQQQYAMLMPEHPLVGSPYAFCTHAAIGGVTDWIERTGYTGSVAYFFEAGHGNQSEANRIMGNIFAVPELRRKTGYVAHAFADKRKSPPLQAADLLAWQFYTDIRRQVEGSVQHRRDFASLIQHPHQITFLTPRMMTDIAKVWGFDTTKAEEYLRRNGLTEFASESPSEEQPS